MESLAAAASVAILADVAAVVGREARIVAEQSADLLHQEGRARGCLSARRLVKRAERRGREETRRCVIGLPSDSAPA